LIPRLSRKRVYRREGSAAAPAALIRDTRRRGSIQVYETVNLKKHFYGEIVSSSFPLSRIILNAAKNLVAQAFQPVQ